MRIADMLPVQLASREQKAQAACCVAAPKGDGVKDISFIVDGPDYGRINQWYDTYDGAIENEPDWYSLDFPQETQLNTLYFMHGPMYVTGGWWTSLEVQYKNESGKWQEVPTYGISPDYDFHDVRGNRQPFETYQLRFPAVETCSIRIVGRPGGSAKVTTISFLGAGYLSDKQAAAVLNALKMPLPTVFQLLPPDKLWELIVKIREITGIAFDLQTTEGLGLDHFLDENRYSQFHSYQKVLTDDDSLYQLIGAHEGWDVFGAEINQAREWVYETQEPEIVRHHGGMAWIVIPVVIDGAALGTLENRNLISIDGPDLTWHRNALTEWKINGRCYSKALKDVPIYSTRRINVIVEMLQVIITLFEEQIQRTREIAQLKDMAESANSAKSEFVAFLSHELRSPITALKGYTSLLQTGVPGPLNDTQIQFLSHVEEGVNQMEQLVAELADISQIESGRLKLEIEPLPIHKIVKGVAANFEIRFKEKSQTLVMELKENLPAVNGDYNRLKQIFTNLISNAHKYTPEGGTIMVQVEETKGKDGRMVHIAISDNGIGIHPQEQDKIFDKFYRAEDSEAREMPGTGLGLSITKELVELHGGRIWLESQFRQGTTFHVNFPAV